VPKGATNPDLAAKWMDFVYDPVNAARITAAISYFSPVEGVTDELRKLGGDAAAIADNPLVFPDEEAQKSLSTFGQLTDEDEATLDAAFSKVQGN